jgi:2-oxoglutarate dehydrogenase E2 component (dihydrolipoamide succinyltransferase)
VSLNAPQAGTIKELLVNEEDTVTVGQDVVKLELGGEPPAGGKQEAKDEPKEPASKDQETSSQPSGEQEQPKQEQPKQETKPDQPKQEQKSEPTKQEPKPQPSKQQSQSKPAKEEPAKSETGSRTENRVCSANGIQTYPIRANSLLRSR